MEIVIECFYSFVVAVSGWSEFGMVKRGPELFPFEPFHSIPSYRRDRVYKLKICLSVCLSVCHHFKISNIGPLYHPRITPDPTYHILLGRG